MTDASERPRQITAEDAAELQRARDRMIARHRLIDGIIRNNEAQLKNDSARGGAEIELECAKRDVAKVDAGAQARAELDRAAAHLEALRDEHRRLVIEREWLNTSLLEFDGSPPTDEDQHSGHA